MPAWDRLLLLAWLAMPLACNQDDVVRATIEEAEDVRRSLHTTIMQADTPQQGVVAAEAILQTRAGALRKHVIQLKSLPSYQMSAPLQAQWRDAFIDDVAALEELRVELRIEIAKDPPLADALQRVIAQYTATLSARPDPED